MRGWSTAAPQAVSTAWVTFALGAVATETGSRAVPSECDLGVLALKLDTVISSGSWTVYLSHDEEGKQPITDYATTGSTRAAVESVLSATDQLVSWDLGGAIYCARPDSGLYLHVQQTDVACNVTPSLTWRGGDR